MCTFQPRHFTSWGSEGVKYELKRFQTGDPKGGPGVPLCWYKQTER